MSLNASVWVVLLVAFVGASLPFVNERLFALVPLRTGRKSLAARLGELVIFYFLAGGVGLLFESRVGQIAPQGWEFYAITAALFVVLAFPGFTWRYLLKHRSSHG
ncbi:DUF2818 family protein [Variovorax sp. J22R133]|uniref:DUF2818 family protein n=1 Tax=Variovorax brevis TaxID=3053503 RepID=UPI0025750304|nr:DUF2818 family protein [Variovorax sp. J22R133]MDM0113277.1 DUF2818 family protein [Variovorax sp. J22R133]